MGMRECETSFAGWQVVEVEAQKSARQKHLAFSR
jgi:hypothetical protein